MAHPPLVPVLTLTLAVVGCGSGGGSPEDTCEGDSCDVQALTCKVQDRSGSGRDVASLADPVAQLVLRAKACPTSLTAIKAALEPCGVGNFTVSEQGQLTGQDAPSRAVMPARCDDRRVFLSPIGEKNVELIAETSRGDSTVFAFYKVDAGKWSFLGDSIDLLAGPGSSGERSCAGCHVSGAPVMKELRQPWVHWKNPDRHLETLETAIRDGIDKVAEARVAHLRSTGKVKDLLEPVLCTHEFNLASAFGSRPVSGPKPLVEVPSNVLSYQAVPLELNGPVPTIEGDFEAAYRARLAAADVNQRVETAPGTPLHGGDGELIRDLAFPLIYPELAAVDQAHIQLLVDQQVITQRFVDDLTLVDFTRPVFSDQRCGLLAFAPDIAAADATPAAIADGFRAALAANRAGLQPHEAELLARLEDTAGDEAHRQARAERLQTFDDACRRLSPEQLVDVAIKAASQLRGLARQHQIIEAREQMPVDDLAVDPAARLDAATCMFR